MGSGTLLPNADQNLLKMSFVQLFSNRLIEKKRLLV